MDRVTRKSHRFSLLVVLAALTCTAPATGWSAEAYPAKPIRFLVGFAPGGVNDLVARAVASHLSARLGQQVIVENRAGAGGNIATQQVARATPDGYTIDPTLSASPQAFHAYMNTELAKWSKLVKAAGIRVE